MSAPRKLYQIAVVPLGDGCAIYARRDDGRIFRCIDRFDRWSPSGEQGEWVELKLPPGVKPFTGDNRDTEY
jgi:hypothetical protein